MITAFQRRAFQQNAFQIAGIGGFRFGEESRRDLRNTIKQKDLNKIFATQRSWPTDINRSYGKIQKVIDTIEEMTPLELAEDELSWRLQQRDEALRNGDQRKVERLGRRINELQTEIYRLKLVAELEKH